MTAFRVPAGRVARGAIAVPPSKSVSHRYFNLTLLSRSPVSIERSLEAEDLTLFGRCLEQVGFESREDGSTTTWVPVTRTPTSAEIDCGNAGTMYRFLLASLTTIAGEWVLTGKPRLFDRPVGALIDALRNLGARIDCPRREGYGPVHIHGGTLRGGSVEIDASESSQYVSALLMAACGASEPVEITVKSLSSSPYLDLTLDALSRFGAHVDRPAEDRFSVRPQELGSAGVRVEGDYSAASYPASAATLTGGRVCLEGLRQHSKQGDRRFLSLLEQLGAQAEWTDRGLEISGSLERAIDVDLSDMPDQVPTLAALAPFLAGTTAIRNVAHLRLKESDRLAVMARELRRTGAKVDEFDDGLVIEGIWAESSPPDSEVEIDPEDDHRIAMSMALVGLRRPGIVIRHPEVVAKSYPHFWRDLETLVR